MRPPTKAVELLVQKGEAYFDPVQAERIITFAHKYVCPQFIHGDFHLLPWEETWLRNLYGWRDAKTKGKLFRKALLHIAKKQGKTLCVSIVCLFELYSPDIPSPLVVSASTTRENAKQVFSEMANTIRRNNKTLGSLAKITPSNKKIRLDKRNSLYSAISCDAGSAEGLNASTVVIDECHAHRSDKLQKSLEYATVARPDSTLIYLSTSGSDLSHWYYSTYTKGKRVLDGTDLDPTFFPTIYEIPDTLDIEDSKNWVLANPSIGVSFSEDAFRKDMQAAKSDTASWLSFQRYRLNKWVQGSGEAAFDVLKFDQCADPMDDDRLKELPMYAAVDLSQSIDPSSLLALWVLPDNHYYVKSWCWTAEDGVRKREKQNLPRYQQFVADGAMVITPGNMIDTKPILAKIVELSRCWRMVSCVFDPTSAFVLANEVAGHGITTYRHPQSFRYMSAPIKELTRAINERRLHHDGKNSWLRWCLNCSNLEVNSLGECRIHRDKSSDHVDASICLVMALGQALAEQAQTLHPRRSVYDERGLFILDFDEKK